MRKIEIEVPDDAEDSLPFVVSDSDDLLIIVFKKERKKPHKHSESKARFQKDVDGHGEAWAIEHWQGKDFSGDWIDILFHPSWDESVEYRRVIKIGNRKVSEPVTELQKGDDYWYADIYGVQQTTFGIFVDNDDDRLLAKVVRLTEQDAQELHEALLAVLAGEQHEQ